MSHLLMLLLLPNCSIPELSLKPFAKVENAFLVKEVAMSENFFAVLMKTPPFVQVLDRTAKEVALWGTRGRGPGELTHPVDIVFKGSKIWVLNKLPNQINMYLTDGTFLKSVSLDRAVFVVAMRASKNLVVIQDGGLYRNPNKLFAIENEKMRFLETLDLGDVVTLEPTSGPPLSLKAPYSKVEFWDLQEPDTLVTYSPENGIARKNSQLQLLEKWHPPSKAYRVPNEAKIRWLNHSFPSSSSALPVTTWRKKAEKVPMPKAFAQVLQFFIDGNKVWLLRAYQPNGQLWECYQNQELICTARLPFSSKVHLIKENLVFLSDASEETPFSIHTFSRKELQ